MTDQVNDPQNSGVLPPEDGPKGGVPAPPNQAVENDPEPQSRDGQPQDVDVEKLRSELEKAQGKLGEYESQMDQMRSSYDQRYARDLAAEQQRAREAEERMHQIAMSTMDEQEKIAYERDIERQRRERLEAQLQDVQAQQQNYTYMMQTAQYFTNLGVDYNDLDFSSPEALYQSGMQQTFQRTQTLEERIKELEQARNDPGQQTPQNQNNQQQTPKAPPISASHGQQPGGQKTMGDVIQALQGQYPSEQWNEDLVMTYIERGQLPFTILDGVKF